MDKDKVIFFDCYQTLLDVQLPKSDEDEGRGWEEFVRLLGQNHGIKIGADEFVALVEKRKADFYSSHNKLIQHHNLRTLVADVLEKDVQYPLKEDEILWLIYEYRKIERGYVHLYPKIASTLALLANEYTLAIASYTQSCFTQFELRELEIEKYFSHFVYSSDVVFRKESPEFYRECLRLVQKSPESCLMVGDNYREDIVIPASLGIHTIWIKNPAARYKNPDPIVEVRYSLDLADFDKLPQIIGQIF